MNTNNEIFQRWQNWKVSDQEYPNELARYGRAVPSRQFIAAALAELQHFTLEDLIRYWQLDKAWQKEALINRIQAMINAKTLYTTSKNTLALSDLNKEVTGKLMGHSEGHGYLIPDSGGEQIFISKEQMRQYLHGDIVRATISDIDYRGRREANIQSLIQRTLKEIIGQVEKRGENWLLIPTNRRFTQPVLLVNHTPKAGEIVRAKLISSSFAQQLATAEVVESFGKQLTPSVVIKIALHEHQIPYLWPDEVIQEIAPLPEQVQSSEISQRLDLRDLPLVTIDGITARDFDDAVYCKRTTHGFELWVAIADVSHYVSIDSPLDQEAVQRATSVYFPDYVVPMLPEKLSNGLCSLNPDVDRLCMACQIQLDLQGNIVSYRFHEAVMRSHARLTYDTAFGILQQDPILRRAYQHLVPALDDLHACFLVRQAQRQQRGAIDFEMHETEIEYDAAGNIERIVPSERNTAHMLIEECMIAANICAANFIETHKIHALFRVHPCPPESRLQKLRAFLREFNLGLAGGMSPTPKDFADCLAAAQHEDNIELIQTVMLRSLAQAVYQPENEGHFGLALTQYAHFTSPIRRYPDLLVHRAIRHILRHNSVENYPYTLDKMRQLGEVCSMAERRADDATREVTEWLKCQYMQNKIGEIYEGKITGVTNFGLFVELSSIYVEGLIHISSLANDYFIFDSDRHRLVGEHSGRIYRLGDNVTIRVVSVNSETRKIDFTLVANESNKNVEQRHKVNKKRAQPTESSAKQKNKSTSSRPTPTPKNTKSTMNAAQKNEKRTTKTSATPKNKKVSKKSRKR